MTENELIHYGVKGMKWGVRRTSAQLARERSSAYNKMKKKWTREPDGGSIKKQLEVANAQSRLKLANTRASRKEARSKLKQAKQDLKDGYKEYQIFEKDMHKKYGKSNQYIYDPDTKKYTHKKTHKTIKDFEYTGMVAYENYRQLKVSQLKNAVKIGTSVTVAVLAATNSIGQIPYAKRY